MADSISDNFVMGNGVAAFALIQATLEHLPKEQLDVIMARALQIVAGMREQKRHAALKIGADLLQDIEKRRQARPSSKAH